MSKKLQFQGGKSPSTGPKVAITSWYLLCASAAVWITFSTRLESNQPGNSGRQAALLACVALYVARAAHTLFEYVKRTIPWWEAAWGAGIIGCVLFFFLLGGLRASQPIGPLDLVGVLLYVAVRDRVFAIFGDEGAHRVVGGPFWEDVRAASTAGRASRMRARFSLRSEIAIATAR